MPEKSDTPAAEGNAEPGPTRASDAALDQDQARDRTRAQTVLTQRLLLRPFEEGDVAAYARIRAKPEVVRFLPGGAGSAASSGEIARRVIAACRAAWAGAPGYGPWALVERASGRLRGHLGLRRLPELGDQTELLYLLDSEVWGRGYALEGAGAALDYGFRELALERVIALALPENARSLRVMARAGMTREAGLTQAFGLALVRHAITRERWIAGRSGAPLGLSIPHNVDSF